MRIIFAALLLTGCASYHETRPDGTRIAIYDIGGGNRSFPTCYGRIIHASIPETLKEAKGLVGEASEGAARGIVKGGL